MLPTKVRPQCWLLARNHKKIIKCIICTQNSASCITLPIIINAIHASHFSSSFNNIFKKHFRSKRGIAIFYLQYRSSASQFDQRCDIITKSVSFTCVFFFYIIKHKRRNQCDIIYIDLTKMCLINISMNNTIYSCFFHHNEEYFA